MNPYKIDMTNDSRKNLTEIFRLTDKFWDMLEARSLMLAHDPDGVRIRFGLGLGHAMLMLVEHHAFTINPLSLLKARES